MEVHRHLDEELDTLRDTVLRLGGEAETALRRAMHALVDRDVTVAREVLEHDDAVDALEVEVDRQCIDIFVLRQPAARDLRFVMSVAKTAPLLESSTASTAAGGGGPQPFAARPRTVVGHRSSTETPLRTSPPQRDPVTLFETGRFRVSRRKLLPSIVPWRIK